MGIGSGRATVGFGGSKIVGRGRTSETSFGTAVLSLGAQVPTLGCSDAKIWDDGSSKFWSGGSKSESDGTN